MEFLKTRMSMFIILLLIIFLAVIFSGNVFINKAETPDVKIIRTIDDKEFGKIEIKKYPRLIFFKTSIKDGTWESGKEGFKALADYIFGDNDKKEKIDMTAPVIKEHESNGKWTMNFIAPKKYKNVSDLPKPNKDMISIIDGENENKVYISILFSGNYSEESMNKHLDELVSYCDKNNFKINKDMQMLLFYNPPWTIPFLKRNEIMFEILNPETLNSGAENAVVTEGNSNVMSTESAGATASQNSANAQGSVNVQQSVSMGDGESQ